MEPGGCLSRVSEDSSTSSADGISVTGKLTSGKGEPDATPPPTASSSSGTVVPNPKKFDVLLGRGRAHSNHPGNRRLQIVVNVNKDYYNASNSRHEKTRITAVIVDQIKRCGVEQGRFLKPNGHGGWIEVEDEVARIKVSQALRYTRRSSHMSIIPEQEDIFSLNLPAHSQNAVNSCHGVVQTKIATSSEGTASTAKVQSSLTIPSSLQAQKQFNMKYASPRKKEPLLSDDEIYAALGYTGPLGKLAIKKKTPPAPDAKKDS